MSGVAIIAELLLADAEQLEPVEPGSVKEDRFPDGVMLPALLLRTVSGSDEQPLRRGVFTRTTERIGVTVRARSARERRAAMDRVRDLCAGRVGDFAGCRRVSVLTAGLGPSLLGPGDTFEQTQDFRVSFDAMT